MTPPYGMLTSFDDSEDWGFSEDAEQEEKMDNSWADGFMTCVQAGPLPSKEKLMEQDSKALQGADEPEPKFHIELFRDGKLLAFIEKGNITISGDVYPRILKMIHEMWTLVFRPETS